MSLSRLLLLIHYRNGTSVPGSSTAYKDDRRNEKSTLTASTMFETFSTWAVSISRGKNQTKMSEDGRPSQSMVVFRIRIGSGFNWVSGSGSGLGIRIQAGHKLSLKKEKKSCLKILNVLCRGLRLFFSSKILVWILIRIGSGLSKIPEIRFRNTEIWNGNHCVYPTEACMGESCMSPRSAGGCWGRTQHPTPSGMWPLQSRKPP
jgi:hypothetical protein